MLWPNSKCFPARCFAPNGCTVHRVYRHLVYMIKFIRQWWEITTQRRLFVELNAINNRYAGKIKKPPRRKDRLLFSGVLRVINQNKKKKMPTLIIAWITRLRQWPRDRISYIVNIAAVACVRYLRFRTKSNRMYNWYTVLSSW